jgi:hypothetical protein
METERTERKGGMARARVIGPFFDPRAPDPVPGDDYVEHYRVAFYGTDLPVVDYDEFSVVIGPTDNIATAQTKLVDAVLALATSRGYNVARTRVVFPDVQRGS